MHESLWSNTRRLIRWIIVLILTVLLILASPIIGLCALPFYILRFVTIKYAQYFRPDLGKILTTRSALFASDDLYGNPKANIVVVITLNGNYDLEEFKRNAFNGAVNMKTPKGDLVYPELRQYLSYFMGFPFWKWDQCFNFENHIKEYDGPISEPVLTQDHLNEICTDYLKAPFIPGRSPWEIVFFPMQCKLKSEDSDEPRMLGMLKCHHTGADGFSIIKVSASMVPDHTITLQAPSLPKISTFRKIIFVVGFLVFAPFEFVNSLIETWDVNECHVSEEKLCPSPVLAFERIPMDYLREIKRAHGTGMTAVLMAAFTGALRSFMVENGYKIPDMIHSVTPYPMPGHSEKLRNFMTSCFVRLPIGLPTAEERLIAIDKNINNLKRSTLPITYFYILALIGALPSWLAKLLFQQNMPTTIISNFPGPQEEIKYLGKPLHEIMFTAGLLPGNIGIGFNAISYNGNMRIQAAFNEALAVKKLPRTFLLDKVILELQILAEKHTV